MVKRNKSVKRMRTQSRTSKYSKSKRRQQRGGSWYNPVSWFSNNTENGGYGDASGVTQVEPEKPGLFSGLGSSLSNLTTKAENGLGDATNWATTKASSLGQSVKEKASTLGQSVKEKSSSLGQSVTGFFSGNSNQEAASQSTEQATQATEQATQATEQATQATEQATQDTLQAKQATVGGRRRKMKGVMKGGKSLGLTYYASPVHGLKVAEPTYWVTGGSKRHNKRKGKKSRKVRKH